MRRFSQRNQLVTLNDINITPLLDLAFVLLIIFIIATPLLEHQIKVNLPGEGQPPPPTPIQVQDIRQVEISKDGAMFLGGRLIQLDSLEETLAADFQSNSNLVVYIRADQDGAYRHVASVLSRCEKHGITQVSLRTDPKARE